MAEPRKVQFVTLSGGPSAEGRRRRLEEEGAAEMSFDREGRMMGTGVMTAGDCGGLIGERDGEEPKGKTVRLNLCLSEPNEQCSAEFNYSELIQSQQVQKLSRSLQRRQCVRQKNSCYCKATACLFSLSLCISLLAVEFKNKALFRGSPSKWQVWHMSWSSEKWIIFYDVSLSCLLINFRALCWVRDPCGPQGPVRTRSLQESWMPANCVQVCSCNVYECRPGLWHLLSGLLHFLLIKKSFANKLTYFFLEIL